MSDISKNEMTSKVIPVDGLYEEYFLDYASYVILERAIPTLKDGLKPVQRRILHSMKEMDDGRYHKVANIIGHTMQFHPHGDAAIGDALVKLGQHNLLIDTQGNWGDSRTGDSAAAPRYIEARLTKFALEISFHKEVTDWQASYDGRKQEPVFLPMKFPLLLAQGAEGIAVGLSTKILPHNFVELIKASIKILEGKSFQIYPDFATGGLIDVRQYQDGERGGRVKVRAVIEKMDKKTLRITELPYGVTTDQLIDSILKANAKGKINIKRITDNTAQDVELIVDLDSKTNPDLTIDALYAFTKCEDSISPNACVIVDNKPVFVTVKEILSDSTLWTKEIIRLELEIQKRDLLTKWHFASLEKIFIEERVYRHIEEAESWEQVVVIVDREMRKFIRTPDEETKDDGRLLLNRPFTEEDVRKLTEIRIRRISKYNKFKAEEYLQQLEDEIAQVEHHLRNLVDFCIAYFESLLQKYGKGKERKTKLMNFDAIEIQNVAANNVKLYADLNEGFVGFGVKGGQLIGECSDIDDIIAFLGNGTFVVNRINEKLFVGKDIIHLDIWRKGDERTTYNLIYTDAKTGVSRAKRFNVKAITRDKPYDLTTGFEHCKVQHFSANPNGEAEIVTVILSPSSKARKKVFEFDFASIDIKGRKSQGNIVSKYPVRKVELKSRGSSTLSAMRVWMDESSGRLNNQELGHFIGEFHMGDQLIIVYSSGEYELQEIDLNFSQKFEPNQVMFITKWSHELIVSAIHYDGDRKCTLVKRFQIETTSLNTRFLFIGESRSSKLLHATYSKDSKLAYVSGDREKEIILSQFIDVKGWKALGNKLEDGKIKKIREEPIAQQFHGTENKEDDHDVFEAGDIIELDF